MNKTVGQILKDTREFKDISLQDVAKATHIRLQYLHELENDHPELLPSKAQARGFLRLYAAFLELDPQELLTQWENSPEVDEEPPAVKRDGLKQKRDISSQDVQPAPVEKKEEALPQEKNKERKFQLPKFLRSKSVDDEGEEKGEPREKSKRKFSLTKLLKTRAAKRSDLSTDKPEVAKIKEEEAQPQEVGEKQARSGVPADNFSGRPSEEIFKEVGQQMRARREKMGLSLSDVEQFTRLRRMYVQAIEDGRIDDLPSSVQGRGMVSNYAHFLEMDDDAVSSLYAEGLETQRRENMQEKWTPREPTVKVSVHLPDKLRRFLSPDLIFGSLVVVGLFVFIFWGASQIFGKGADETPTAAPSISEMLQNTSTPTVILETQLTEEGTLTGEQTGVPVTTQAETQVVAPVATANAAPLQLYIIAQQRAWMRITVDGVIGFEGRTVPGNAYTFSGDDRIVLQSGNGAALEVYFNQEYLGNLGAMGEVINLDFSQSGLTVPTPTITPTPAATSTPTVTPSATPTTTQSTTE